MRAASEGGLAAMYQRAAEAGQGFGDCSDHESRIVELIGHRHARQQRHEVGLSDEAHCREQALDLELTRDLECAFVDQLLESAPQAVTPRRGHELEGRHCGEFDGFLRRQVRCPPADEH